MRWMATLLMVCALATGCESDKGNGGGGKLVGTKWRLQAWSVSSLDPTRFNITAEFGDAQISGTAAVNLYGGPYTASDGNFSVGDLYITQMAGSEAAMRAEAIYMDLLGQARHYEVTGTTLTLRNAGNQNTLVFRSTSQKILEFSGTVTWQALESGFFAIDADNGQKYEPIGLPEAYRVSGLRVHVQAKERGDLASINMYGTMLEIISIAKL